MLLVLVALSTTAAATHSWSYEDQAAWLHLDGSSCGGEKQSPIDIPAKTAVRDPALGEAFTCSWANPNEVLAGVLTNNGHTIQLNLRATPSSECKGVPGMPAETTFVLKQLHIHISNDSRTRGSEHLIDGVGADLELHMVHLNSKFSTFEEAMGDPDAILAVGILFNHAAETTGNNELQKLAIAASARLVTMDTTLPMAFDPGSLLSGTGLSNDLPGGKRFLTYRGSLTTPHCNEVVTWVIGDGKGAIGEQTLELLRRINGVHPGEKLGPNVRDVQPLNGRVVRASFIGPPGLAQESAAPAVATSLILGASLILAVVIAVV